MHEDWLPYRRHSTTDTDIAVIKLTSAVEMNSNVKTIDLPSRGDKFDNQDCMISG